MGLLRLLLQLCLVSRPAAQSQPGGMDWVPMKHPFQVVMPVPNHTAMLTVSEGLAMLQKHDRPISLVSVVGPYHSGKSFLLNSLIGDLSVFSVGRQTAPETMGIWLCRTELRAADGSEVWLMDSEGFFGPGVDQNYDAKVFTLASLLGAHVIYNTVKTIDQQAVNLLELLVTQAQLFRARSHVKEFDAGVPEFLDIDNLPPFTWVVEDFVQDLPEDFRREGTTGSLATYLTSSTARGMEVAEHNVSFLTKLYRDVRVHPLFLPATGKAELADLSRLSLKSLTPEFREEIDSLRRHLLANVQARTFNGRKATGPVLAQALHFALRALEQGMFNELPSLWVSWSTQVSDVTLGDAEAWFAKLIESVDSGHAPVNLTTFNARLESARDQALRFYHKLLKDFGVRPQASKLQDRMHTHFRKLLTLYHERVRRWIADLIGEGKARFAHFLDGQPLPMDPVLLERDGGAQLEQVEKGLSAFLRAFVEPGPRLKLGDAATMPSFGQDPVLHLRADLRALLGKRGHENELELNQILKHAAASAGDAVSLELKAREGQFMSKSSMKGFLDSLERLCWETFDRDLRRYSWILATNQYRATRALVKTEDYDARLGRFVSQHNARLQEYLRAGLERSLAGYRSNRTHIPMPTAEEEVSTTHALMLAAASDQFLEHGAGLQDTDQFVEMRKILDATLKEGLKQVQDKNIQLWKVHSDDATRCAAIGVMERERHSGFLSLFGTMPWYHRTACRGVLLQCLEQSSLGSRMPHSIQKRVFEVWYAQDMAKSAGRASNRMYVWLVTFAVLGAGAAYLWHSRGQQQQQQQQPAYYGGYYQQPTGYTTYATYGYGAPNPGCYMAAPGAPPRKPWFGGS